MTVNEWCCGLLECANYGPPPPTSALRVTWWRFSRNASFTLLNIYVFIGIRGTGPPREFVDPRAKWNLAPPPILQIMILKLSPPWCVISKESVQQNWIDELWFRKQLSTCLFVWILADPPPSPLSGPEGTHWCVSI
jgi:hypothetical protein